MIRRSQRYLNKHVMHVYWCRIWISAVTCPMAIYLIWLCIKFQPSQGFTAQTMVRFQNKCFFTRAHQVTAAVSLSRMLVKSSGRGRPIAGTEHTSISPWVAVKTCSFDVACCSQIIPYCPTPTHPHTPKCEQAWTGSDEYLIGDIHTVQSPASMPLWSSSEMALGRVKISYQSWKWSGTRESQTESRNGTGLLPAFSAHCTALVHDLKLYIHSARRSLSTYLWNSCWPARNFSWVNLVWDPWKSCYWDVKGIFFLILLFLFCIEAFSFPYLSFHPLLTARK